MYGNINNTSFFNSVANIEVIDDMMETTVDPEEIVDPVETPLIPLISSTKRKPTIQDVYENVSNFTDEKRKNRVS